MTRNRGDQNHAPRRKHPMYEYKVLTERDKRFTGSFDADTLEATLNSYAAEGCALRRSG